MYVNIMIAACRVEVGYGKNIWANIGRNIVPAAAVKGGAISEVSFSSCQRNLIKTFQIDGMIALITKMDLIFS